MPAHRKAEPSANLVIMNSSDPHSESAPLSAEAQVVARRYGERDARVNPARYSLLDPAALAMHQERLAAIVHLLRRQRWADLSEARIVEPGCGSGGNLLDFIRLGARPAHLRGIELMPERLAQARERLPAQVGLLEGDACDVPVASDSVDIVAQFTVFSSLLDQAYQQRLARAMWSWLKPGGAVLWYDFVINNPLNPDVRGVPLARVRALFPLAQVGAVHKLTLAPPLARAACALSPQLYAWLNVLPWLRTHRLIWLRKP